MFPSQLDRTHQSYFTLIKFVLEHNHLSFLMSRIGQPYLINILQISMNAAQIHVMYKEQLYVWTGLTILYASVQMDIPDYTVRQVHISTDVSARAKRKLVMQSHSEVLFVLLAPTLVQEPRESLSCNHILMLYLFY